MGSVDEVKCSVVKLVFSATLSVVPVTNVGPGGLVGLVSEVIVVESTGVSPSVIDPAMEETDSVLEI